MRSVRWLAVVVASMITLTACAGDPDDGVASLEGDGTTGETSASPTVDPEEALQAFAECMRKHGVEDFPDPQINDDGGIEIRGPAGMEGDEDRKALDDAMRACEDLLPDDVGPGAEGGPSAEEQAALEDAFLAYAQCMREHGIDMPDPQFSHGGVIQGGGDFDPEDPAFQRADEACKHFLDDAGINIKGGAGD